MNIVAVAKRARVSIATVSRVINGTAVVSAPTAERVRLAIEALNFFPDVNARSLGSGRSGMYGLIISDITNPYFPELVKAFEDIAVEHGQEILVANTNYDPQRMKHCVARMLQRRVDGVAIMTSEIDHRLTPTFTQRKIPLVFLDASASKGADKSVQVNYESGIQQGVAHLVQLGHRHISFISGPLTLYSAHLREQAFRSEIARRGLKSYSHWIQEADHRAEGGHHAMLRILQGRSIRPTAVMASNDLTAIGAMGALHEVGLRIPQDMSVVGFDGIELGAYTHPALTTLSVSRKELAAQAFRFLYSDPRKGQVFEAANVSVIEPTLLERGSTETPRNNTQTSFV